MEKEDAKTSPKQADTTQSNQETRIQNTIKTVCPMSGLEGLSSHHEKETNRLYKDQEKWKAWTEILLRTCTHPSVVGNCEHFLLVGRKKR